MDGRSQIKGLSVLCRQGAGTRNPADLSASGRRVRLADLFASGELTLRMWKRAISGRKGA
jgi:hypothetical protein